MTSLLNKSRFEEYRSVFGLAKMKKLWRDFLLNADDCWHRLENCDYEEQRTFFHNWRSSSRVFGMEAFSSRCTQIEEDILCRRFSKIPELISSSKLCYDDSVREVETIFSRWEKNDE